MYYLFEEDLEIILSRIPDVFRIIVMMLSMLVFYWSVNYADQYKNKQTGARILSGFLHVVFAMIHTVVPVALICAITIFNLGPEEVFDRLPNSTSNFTEWSYMFPEVFVLRWSQTHISPLYGYFFILCGILGIAVLIRPVRRLLARIIPINSDSTLHALALSSSILIFAQFAVCLILAHYQLFDLDNILLLMMQQYINSDWLEITLDNILQILGLLKDCFLVIIAVGYLSRRNWNEVLQRLGLKRLTLERIKRGVLWAFLLAGIVTSLDLIINYFVPSTPNSINEQLFNGVDSDFLTGVYVKMALWVLVVSLSAGIGEEILFRGALQPRFGIIYTSLLFVFIHGQYAGNLPSFVVVFGLSLLFGKLRQKYDTTTTIVIHSIYDVIIFGLAVF